MVYARKRKRFRRSFKRRKGRKVARISTVKRMISRREESKFGYSSGGPTAVTTGAPTMAIVFGFMNQGAANTQRIGQKITCHSMQFRLACDCNVAGASRIRVLIVRDKQTNGALPASAQDWFMDKNAATSWYSLYDPSTVGPRYEILCDKSRQLNIGGGNAQTPLKSMISWRMKRKPFSVVYNIGNAGTIADINKNSILLCVYTDAVANGPSYVFDFAAKYKDA